MKILPYDPQTLALPKALDDSRLGNHVKPVTIATLAEVPHGIAILGFADDTGIRNVGGRLGAASGPRALREKLYRFTTGAPLQPVYDLGDLPAQATIEETHAAGAELVRRALENGHTPVVVGGGHDFGFPHALGQLQARGAKPMAVVNIDAHLDVRPVQGAITSGSPWFLLREHPLFGKSRIEEFGIQDHCNAHSLLAYAKSRGLGMNWLTEIRAGRGGAAGAFSRLLKRLAGFDSTLISFDIDSVQWADAPGCSAPQTLGFTAEEAIHMSLLSGQQKKVKSFGLFELSPPLDPDGRTATLAAHCINAFLRGKGVWGKNRVSGKAARA